MIPNRYSKTNNKYSKSYDPKQESKHITYLKIVNLNNTPIRKVKKFVPNLFDKETYVISHKNFKIYLTLGLKLKKIHRALEFKQSKWLKPYIEFNTKNMRSRKKWQRWKSVVQIND